MLEGIFPCGSRFIRLSGSDRLGCRSRRCSAFASNRKVERRRLFGERVTLGHARMLLVRPSLASPVRFDGVVHPHSIRIAAIGLVLHRPGDDRSSAMRGSTEGGDEAARIERTGATDFSASITGVREDGGSARRTACEGNPITRPPPKSAFWTTWTIHSWLSSTTPISYSSSEEGTLQRSGLKWKHDQRNRPTCSIGAYRQTS